ncbi:MAG: NADH-quinone oxidoreductase subunit NuoE [Synergistaceae bacterium]|jgi:NADH-quinone oxidoreductase subunit E|nr:NADH-quinone oxidoreductase subunit NuoE [Synergistaceae bacterium]
MAATVVGDSVAPALGERELAARLGPIVELYRGKQGVAIPLLADIQKEMGYVAREAVEYAGKELSIPAAELFGVATFYAMFRFQPQGKYVVRLCRGTACHVQGSARVQEQLERTLEIHDGETTKDLMFTLQCVACLGCCSLAPVMMVNDDVHGRLTPEKAIQILGDLRNEQ